MALKSVQFMLTSFGHFPQYLHLCPWHSQLVVRIWKPLALGTAGYTFRSFAQISNVKIKERRRFGEESLLVRVHT